MNASRLFANLPNLITLARLLMAPLAVSMIVSQRFVAAFMIFVAAGISDGVGAGAAVSDAVSQTVFASGVLPRSAMWRPCENSLTT